MPHLLIAGTTGSGKSVMINSIITTLLMRALPEDVRLIMVDPKRVELAGYNGLPHLYVPVVTEPKQAASALQWAVSEMERRLKVFERLNVRKISTYNEKQAAGEFEHYDNPPQKMPYLVIIIDELSDLMMVAGKDVEASIVRIAQLGRAAGIHLIVATQRPSSNVVTGLIKANITNRIAFNVATGIDSRVIIDQMGAEKLTGLGDMLFSKVDWGKPRRIQGCFARTTRSTRSSSSLSRKASPTTTRRSCLPWRLPPCLWLVAAALFARVLPSRRMTTRLSGKPPILWWNRSWAPHLACNAASRLAMRAPGVLWTCWKKRVSSARPTVPSRDLAG